MALSEQEIVRREALQKIIDMGVNPYPAETFPVNYTSAEIIENFNLSESNFQDVIIAGRLMQKRIMGKASFAEIQDQTGRIQIYLNRDEICPGEDKANYNDLFKKYLDIGDIIGIKGHAFETQTGQTTIHVEEFQLLSKSLKPIPLPKEKDGEIYDAFTDPEQRYRQRYVDLIVNPHVREAFIQRSKMVNAMRQFMNNSNFLEVETPILQPIYGGAAASPFTTHHNTLDQKLYLRIANELYLKRLIVGGFKGVFEFGKNFRNEGMSRKHNPEFTAMELYVAFKDVYWMMDYVEEMLEYVTEATTGSTEIQVGENMISFKRPWKRFTMYGAIKEHTGIDVSRMDEEALRKTAKDLHIEIDDTMGRGKLIDEIFGEKVEHLLIQPTFITDYPIEMSPLAKKHRTEEGLVERFEVIVNAKELCNAFSELNDPLDQRERFEKQMELGKRGDDEAMMLDEDYLNALSYGMPPAAGIGIGIDRLAMLMTNSDSIQDVLFFPQMKNIES